MQHNNIIGEKTTSNVAGNKIKILISTHSAALHSGL